MKKGKTHVRRVIPLFGTVRIKFIEIPRYRPLQPFSLMTSCVVLMTATEFIRSCLVREAEILGEIDDNGDGLRRQSGSVGEFLSSFLGKFSI